MIESPQNIILFNQELPADIAGRILAELINNSLNILKIERLGSQIRKEDVIFDLNDSINKLAIIKEQQKSNLRQIEAGFSDIEIECIIQIRKKNNHSI